MKISANFNFETKDSIDEGRTRSSKREGSVTASKRINFTKLTYRKESSPGRKFSLCEDNATCTSFTVGNNKSGNRQSFFDRVRFDRVSLEERSVATRLIGARVVI